MRSGWTTAAGLLKHRFNASGNYRLGRCERFRAQSLPFWSQRRLKWLTIPGRAQSNALVQSVLLHASCPGYSRAFNASANGSLFLWLRGLTNSERSFAAGEAARGKKALLRRSVICLQQNISTVGRGTPYRVFDVRHRKSITGKQKPLLLGGHGGTGGKNVIWVQRYWVHQSVDASLVCGQGARSPLTPCSNTGCSGPC